MKLLLYTSSFLRLTSEKIAIVSCGGSQGIINGIPVTAFKTHKRRTIDYRKHSRMSGSQSSWEITRSSSLLSAMGVKGKTFEVGRKGDSSSLTIRVLAVTLYHKVSANTQTTKLGKQVKY